MHSITDKRIRDICSYLLGQDGGGNIGFIDVGSGGNLKAPWSLLPPERLSTFNFEPTDSDVGSLPLCISNRTGTAPFFVAHDERASSFHKPLKDFVDRYGFNSMLTKKTTTVACTSLDEHFAGRYELPDAIDINVEGHDYQVLQGASNLLAAGAIKLLKVEFELTAVYEGQGYFSDIDAFLRARDFRLAHIQVDDVSPVNLRHLFHSGESIWGKALYAPTQARLAKRLSGILNAENIGAARREAASAIALYTAAKLPGYAYDVIGLTEITAIYPAVEAQQLRARVVRAFQWAKQEHRLHRLLGLAWSLVDVMRGKR